MDSVCRCRACSVRDDPWVIVDLAQHKGFGAPERWNRPPLLANRALVAEMHFGVFPLDYVVVERLVVEDRLGRGEGEELARSIRAHKLRKVGRIERYAAHVG